MIFNIVAGDGENKNLPPVYTIDGVAQSGYVDEGNGNWHIKVTATGNHALNFQKFNSAKKGIDLFLLGGGYNGGQGWGEREGEYRGSGGGNGGNGGKYVTVNNITISQKAGNIITVGVAAGDSTAFDNTSANGSYSGIGGTGAEVYGYNNANGGNGTGSITPWSNSTVYGTYGGGGGGGAAARGGLANGGNGSANGGNGGASNGSAVNGGIGGGGGGGGVYYDTVHSAGAGGSGIIIIRNHRS